MRFNPEDQIRTALRQWYASQSPEDYQIFAQLCVRAGKCPGCVSDDVDTWEPEPGICPGCGMILCQRCGTAVECTNCEILTHPGELCMYIAYMVKCSRCGENVCDSCVSFCRLCNVDYCKNCIQRCICGEDFCLAGLPGESHPGCLALHDCPLEEDPYHYDD